VFIPLRDGLRLHVREEDGPREDGSGEPLLLLHGFTGSSEAWVVDSVATLTSDRRVILVDLLGHGRSDRPTNPGRYALSEVLRDLAEVLDALEFGRADWLGYSMGGRLALAAAVLMPERVSRLVLESASPGLRNETEREERRRTDGKLAGRLERDGIDSFVKLWMALPLFRTQRRLDPDLLKAESARRRTNDPHALAACLRGFGTGLQPSFWSELPEINAPTLVMVGEEDPRFAEVGREMSSLFPDGRISSFPDTGHAIHLERPREWASAVGSFLGEIDLGRTASLSPPPAWP
jgi:2-succinyl-6-hydroxy-2,4-cyclohexadiene-1-carboxylate synthase